MKPTRISEPSSARSSAMSSREPSPRPEYKIPKNYPLVPYVPTPVWKTLGKKAAYFIKEWGPITASVLGTGYFGHQLNQFIQNRRAQPVRVVPAEYAPPQLFHPDKSFAPPPNKSNPAAFGGEVPVIPDVNGTNPMNTTALNTTTNSTT